MQNPLIEAKGRQYVVFKKKLIKSAIKEEKQKDKFKYNHLIRTFSKLFSTPAVNRTEEGSE